VIAAPKITTDTRREKSKPMAENTKPEKKLAEKTGLKTNKKLVTLVSSITKEK